MPSAGFSDSLGTDTKVNGDPEGLVQPALALPESHPARQLAEELTAPYQAKKQELADRLVGLEERQWQDESLEDDRETKRLTDELLQDEKALGAVSDQLTVKDLGQIRAAMESRATDDIYKLTNVMQNGISGNKQDDYYHKLAELTEKAKLQERPTWGQSENDAAKYYPGYEYQKSFKNGKTVKYGLKGSVRPDYYFEGNSIEVKNYDLSTNSGKNSLIRTAVKQYYQRQAHLPQGTEQNLLIDIRGQKLIVEDLKTMVSSLQTKTNHGLIINFMAE